MLENGKNKRFGESLLRLICAEFSVSPEWVKTGIVNRERWNDVYNAILVVTPTISFARQAARVGVPEKFFREIYDGNIMPSENLFAKIVTAGTALITNNNFNEIELREVAAYHRGRADACMEQIGAIMNRLSDIIERIDKKIQSP